jgi:large subunit ribosomal protein L15
MKFNELETKRQKKQHRVGRGISAGRGKTAGRGTKGQNARKSGGVRPGFEGGQSPMMQQLPKLRGFRSHKAKTYEVYTSQLNELGAKVDNETVAKAGLVPDAYCKVKVIANGDISKKISVSLQVATAGAEKAIKKAGGTFTAVPRKQRVAKKTDKK